MQAEIKGFPFHNLRYACTDTHTHTHARMHTCSCMQAHTHSLTHSLTHSIDHSLPYSLAHSLTHSLTRNPPYADSSRTTAALKPHMGAAGSPFMNTTTGDDCTVCRERETRGADREDPIAILLVQLPPSFRNFQPQTPLLFQGSLQPFASSFVSIHATQI